MNSDIEINLRKFRTNLAGSGTGYILFGIWTVIKIFMTATMKRSFIEGIMSDIDLDIDKEMSEDATRRIVYMLVYVFLFLIALIALLIHLYIGMSAIKFSSKEKTSRFFVACSILIMLMNILQLPNYFETAENNLSSYQDRGIVPAVVDLTVVFLLFDIIYSVHRIDSLENKKKKIAQKAAASGSEEESTGD